MLRNGWNDWHMLGALVMCLLGVVATAGVWRDIWQTAARHGEAGPLVLVPIVVAWLVWVRRERLRLCEPVGTWLGPMLVIGGWLGSTLGDLFGYAVFTHIGAVSILIGCILSVVGMDVLQRFAPAFVAVLFLIPAPWVVHEHVIQPFNAFVTETSVLIYRLFGVEAEVMAGTLVLEGTPVPVIEACGAPGFKAIVLVAYGFAFAKPLRAWARAVVLVCTPVLAVATQILSATIAAWVLHHQTDGQTQWWGLVAGWLLLPLVPVLLVGVIRVLKWASAPVLDYRLAQE